MVEYLICLNLYILKKLNADSLENSKVIEKLLYNKTLINKLKPVEKKLDY